METTKRKEREVGTFFDMKFFGIWSKTTLIMAAMMCCVNANAQKVNPVITISGEQFATPLIEKWVTEYTKINPGTKIQVVKNISGKETTDLKLIVKSLEKDEAVKSQDQVDVGRLALLPVTNEKNTLFAKQLKNGIRQGELKNLFLQEEVDSISEPNEKPSIEPLYTVYTQSPQSVLASVLINHFGKPTSELNGVIVTGDDKYLIESVLEDSTGVSYNNLSLIYDLNKRTPIQGIKILPIDLDNNGRLKKEELIYDTIDQLISYLESSKNKTIPASDISFSFNAKNLDPQAADFVNWVNINGQQFNHQYGFLNSDDDKTKVLTQK